MSENGPATAAIYARVSTSDQDVSRQLDEAHEHLERLGVEDIEEYPDSFHTLPKQTLSLKPNVID